MCVWKLQGYIVGYQNEKRAPVIKLIAVYTIFMWLYSNFQQSVMTVMLTHGWPLCMFPGFESPRNRFWLNGIISQTVPLWTGPRRRRSFRLRSRVMCTVVSGGADNAAPFFFSTVYRCCCCTTTTPTHFPIAATAVPCDRSTQAGIRE